MTQISEVYIWVLSGVLGFVVTVGTIILSSVARNLGRKLESLTDSIERLNVCTATQTEQIKTLFNDKQTTERRLNDHSDRIRHLEIKSNGHI